MVIEYSNTRLILYVTSGQNTVKKKKKTLTKSNTTSRKNQNEQKVWKVNSALIQVSAESQAHQAKYNSNKQNQSDQKANKLTLSEVKSLLNHKLTK